MAIEFTAVGRFIQLLREDGSPVSQHIVEREAIERASREADAQIAVEAQSRGPGTHTITAEFVMQPPVVRVRVTQTVVIAAPPTQPPVDPPVEPPPVDPPPVEPPPVDPPVEPPPPVDPPPVDPPPPPPPPPTGLIQKANLVYEGAFTGPLGSGGDENKLTYGGAALAHNPARNSLFIRGHDHHQRTAEITMPGFGTGSVGSLPRASFLQAPVDATRGRLGQIDPTDSGKKTIAGQLVVDDRLILAAYTNYDASDPQVASHFSRSVNLSDSTVIGPVAVPGARPRWIGGPMCHIPAAWQSRLGGVALTGIAGISIVDQASNGPCAAVFNPLNLNAAAQVLVGYPRKVGSAYTDLATLMGHSPTSGANPIWNHTSECTGMVFVRDSLLFFGRHGKGQYGYGNDGTYQGNHAPPYVYNCWAYAAADLERVRLGQRQSHEILPYAVWEFDLPYAHEAREIGGACLVGDRVIISARYGEGTRPVLHSLRVV